MAVIMRMSLDEKRSLPPSANLNLTTATFDEDLDRRIGAAIHALRSDRGMFRTQLAARLGIKETGVRRHEMGKTKLSVSRLIQLCEVFNANPVEVLCAVAPHLFGRTEESALQMTTMVKILSQLNEEALTSVFKVMLDLGPYIRTTEDYNLR